LFIVLAGLIGAKRKKQQQILAPFFQKIKKLSLGCSPQNTVYQNYKNKK
jgi:hypothetical protein